MMVLREVSFHLSRLATCLCFVLYFRSRRVSIRVLFGIEPRITDARSFSAGRLGGPLRRRRQSEASTSQHPPVLPLLLLLLSSVAGPIVFAQTAPMTGTTTPPPPSPQWPPASVCLVCVSPQSHPAAPRVVETMTHGERSEKGGCECAADVRCCRCVCRVRCAALPQSCRRAPPAAPLRPLHCAPLRAPALPHARVPPAVPPRRSDARVPPSTALGAGLAVRPAGVAGGVGGAGGPGQCRRLRVRRLHPPARLWRVHHRHPGRAEPRREGVAR